MLGASTVADWLWTVAASSAGTALLLAAAGFLARSQITHWLNRDLEASKAQYQRDLEAAKAQYQRELEAYKVSLIAESERVKAAQDVKKASAVKILEKRFQALDTYHRAFNGLANDFASTAQVSPDLKSNEEEGRLLKRLNVLKEAEDALDVFLDSKEQLVLIEFRGSLVKNFMPHIRAGRDSLVGEALANAMINADPARRAAENLIRSKLVAMQLAD